MWSHSLLKKRTNERTLMALSARIKTLDRTVTWMGEVEMRTRQSTGRPPATSHTAIETAAFALFEGTGFDDCTADDIAEAAGIGRRTLFRYFPSKFYIPLGQFELSLAYVRDAGARPLVTRAPGCLLQFRDALQAHADLRHVEVLHSATALRRLVNAAHG